MKIELFDARILAPLVNFVDGVGARSESLLNRARIPGELIERGGWITKRQAYDFTGEVVKSCGAADAVYAAYSQFELQHLGPICQAMKSCKTVKEAFDVGTRLGNIAYEGNQYFLQIDGETTWFCYREPRVISPAQAYICDMTLMVYYQLVRITTALPWRPKQILTRGEVIDRHHSVKGLEGCRATYHPELSALAFPTRFLSRRLPWKFPEEPIDETRAWLFTPESAPPIVDVLYRLVASRFPHRKLPTLEQVAQMVGQSPATIKRQLHASGTTYSRLLDRIRFETACEMLADPALSITEIAHDLGYSGPNNFIRAFRRMNGVTPTIYRRQQNGESE